MASLPQHTFAFMTKRAERLAEFSPRLHWSANIWAGHSIINGLEWNGFPPIQNASLDLSSGENNDPADIRRFRDFIHNQSSQQYIAPQNTNEADFDDIAEIRRRSIGNQGN